MDTKRSYAALSQRQFRTALTYTALTSSSTIFYRCTHILALEVAHTSLQLTSHVARESNKAQLKLPFSSA
eukprot:4507265-Ditylum_brightwellii.AAC.1